MTLDHLRLEREDLRIRISLARDSGGSTAHLLEQLREVEAALARAKAPPVDAQPKATRRTRLSK